MPPPARPCLAICEAGGGCGCAGRPRPACKGRAEVLGTCQGACAPGPARAKTPWRGRDWRLARRRRRRGIRCPAADREPPEQGKHSAAAAHAGGARAARDGGSGGGGGAGTRRSQAGSARRSADRSLGDGEAPAGGNACPVPPRRGPGADAPPPAARPRHGDRRALPPLVTPRPSPSRRRTLGRSPGALHAPMPLHLSPACAFTLPSRRMPLGMSPGMPRPSLRGGWTRASLQLPTTAKNPALTALPYGRLGARCLKTAHPCQKRRRFCQKFGAVCAGQAHALNIPACEHGRNAHFFMGGGVQGVPR